MIKLSVSVTLVIIMMPVSVSALDLRFQPRFKTGIQYYEYEQESFTTPARDPLGRFPNMQSNLKFNDYLPFVSGGATFFVDRFFVDFDVIYSFDGQDQTRQNSDNFIAGNAPGAPGTVLEISNSNNADFDRLEWAVSVGFEVIDDLVVFAGYKKAKTKFNSTLVGDLAGLNAIDSTPVPPLTGTFTSRLDQKFGYEGPFVGANYSWRINQGFMDGALSFNFAVAFMDGTVDLRFSDFVTNTATGTAEIPFQDFVESGGRGSFSNNEGDTIGFSIGTAWKGLTPIDGLVYSVGVAGYRYNFNSKDTSDFSETQVRADFSLAYAFDF